ncbi:MAG: FAD-dependent oxidoreductase [Pseudomonadota bacterium]
MHNTAEQLPPKVITPPERGPLPVIVVGNGPSGMRVVRELLSHNSDIPIIIYGEEQYEAYNRVQLSSWLAGEIDWETLLQPLDKNEAHNVTEKVGYKIDSINVDNKTVTDNTGNIQHYSKLVLATGSNPHIPKIKGIHATGVYTFRNLKDANALLARRASSHHTVVLGGGLLGIESARAMQIGNTKVTLIENTDRLLGQQLDNEASKLLQKEIVSLGIDIIIGDGVIEAIVNERLNGIRLRSGKEIACDTLIVATGIRPNINLAKSAGLTYSRGITVNNAMQTSNRDIYAIGECVEYQSKVYGLVAPGLEQASVAAANISKIVNNYAGSIAASRLKVVGTQVFSMGPMGVNEIQHFGITYSYHDDKKGVYRKILVHRYRLKGAIGIGDWAETVRLQTIIGKNKWIFPWQIVRFINSGNIWPEEVSQSVNAWPSHALVCQCMGVTRGSIGNAISAGACKLEEVSKKTGASTVCGSCKPLVQDLLGTQSMHEPVAMYKTLIGFSSFALLAALLFFLAPAIPYATSVQHDWHWDVLWREQFNKQVSGFTILGLFIVGLLVSLRKRIRIFDKLGKFEFWRMFHILLGILAVLGLVAHTGFRMGNGLSFFLMLSFTCMIFVGAISTGVIGFEHRISNALATRVRRLSVLWHILLFWPVPVLLAWHILKSYWY